MPLCCVRQSSASPTIRRIANACNRCNRSHGLAVDISVRPMQSCSLRRYWPEASGASTLWTASAWSGSSDLGDGNRKFSAITSEALGGLDRDDVGASRLYLLLFLMCLSESRMTIFCKERNHVDV